MIAVAKLKMVIFHSYITRGSYFFSVTVTISGTSIGGTSHIYICMYVYIYINKVYVYGLSKGIYPQNIAFFWGTENSTSDGH